jgi:hypothetical protein
MNMLIPELFTLQKVNLFYRVCPFSSKVTIPSTNECFELIRVWKSNRRPLWLISNLKPLFAKVLMDSNWVSNSGVTKTSFRFWSNIAMQLSLVFLINDKTKESATPLLWSLEKSERAIASIANGPPTKIFT